MATAHPRRLKPVLLYNGRVQGSNERGRDEIALSKSSLVQILVPLELSVEPSSQNAAALVSKSLSAVTDFGSGKFLRSFARTTVS